MFPGVTVVAGPAQSGKTQRLLDLYRHALKTGRPDVAVWLAPSRRSAADIRDRLLGPRLTACFTPNCWTFSRFAQLILDASPQPMRPLTPLMKRDLLRRLIETARAVGQLTYFGPIADTPGLLDLLDQFISEVKRLEIWPDEFARACGARGLSAKDRELAWLYRAYQEQLHQHQAYDAEGRFWSARTLLREGQMRPFERLRYVVVDGFTDFTRTEHEMLDVLANRAESLLISLPWEPEPRRNDLFAKSCRTLAELQRRHPALVFEETPRPTADVWPALRHIEQHIFLHPRDVRTAPDTQGIEIWAAAGKLNEVEMIGNRLKQLLTSGDPRHSGQVVRPGEILIVLRSLAESGELIREIFAELGIPVAIETQPNLDRASVLTALVGLLRLKAEDWPFRPLLTLLAHNFFRPPWPEWQAGRAAVAAEHLIRQLQIPSGQRLLLRQLERWATQAGPPEPPPDSDRAASTDHPSHKRWERWRRANLAWPLLRRLEQALAQLPTQATPREWADALQVLAQDTGLLLGNENAGVVGASDDADRAAWECLTSALHAIETLAQWLDEPPPRLTLSELLARLLDILRSEQLPQSLDEVGRVRVLSAANARNLSAPYVFFAGLSEKAFPPPERDDRVYSEAETARLIAAGLPLAARADRNADEMLFFYEVLTRATRQLVLSYPALDDKAQPLSPSPYLTEVERACGERTIARRSDLQLSPVPQSSDLFCPRDLRVKALALALEGDSAMLAGVCQREPAPGVAGNMLAALRVGHQRQRGQSFGPFEGLLLSEAAREKLVERFGPDRCWSPSQLERYANCPYQFFMQRVLHLEPLEDLALEVDYLTRGQMLHGSLATLHRRLNERRTVPSSPGQEQEADYVREIAEILAALSEEVRSENPLDNALREVDRRLLSDWLASYREQHRTYDEAWQDWEQPLLPAYFEVSFGPTRELLDPEQPDLELGASDGLSTPQPFELTSGAESIRLSGRIDRIDVGTVAGQPVFSIVDYKSGSAARLNARAIADGLALQLPLYALAVQEMLLAGQHVMPWRAAYWFVKGTGYKEAIKFASREGDEVLSSEEWESQRAKLVQRVLALVRGIRQGQFPMFSADDECTSHCPYHTVCRVHQVRSLEKTWQPPQGDPT